MNSFETPALALHSESIVSQIRADEHTYTAGLGHMTASLLREMCRTLWTALGWKTNIQTVLWPKKLNNCEESDYKRLMITPNLSEFHSQSVSSDGQTDGPRHQLSGIGLSEDQAVLMDLWQRGQGLGDALGAEVQNRAQILSWHRLHLYREPRLDL